MPKAGLLHDYDLMANQEESAQGNTCVICDVHPVTYQWSDYHGEGMCTQCGCAYQLRAGGETMEKEGKYPYCSLLESFRPVAREYWAVTHKFAHYGMSLSRNDGMPELNAWIKEHHPKLIKKPS